MPAPMPNMTSPQAATMLHRAAVHPGVSQTHQAVRGAMAAGAIPGVAAQREQGQAQAQAASAAIKDERPGFITRSLDKLNSLASGFFMYDFFVATGLAAVVGGIGKALAWTGEKTKVKALEKTGGWFGRRSDNLQAPRKYMEGVQVSEGLSTTTRDLHGKTAQWFGEESAVARGMGSVAEGAAKAETRINRTVGSAFRSATTQLGNVVERVDAPMHGVAGMRQRRAQKHHARLQERLEAARTTLGKHEAALVGDANPEAAKHLQAVRSGLEELHGTMQGMPTAEVAQEAEGLLGRIRESYAKLHEIHAEDAGMKTVRKEVNAALKGLHKPMKGLSENAQKAAFWRDVPGAIRKLPESMGQMDLHQAAFNTAITAGTLAEGAHTAFNIKHDFHILKRMVAAVEGKKESEISTLHVLTGNLPQVLKDARHHFIGKHGPEAIAETLLAGLNVALMRKGGAGMSAMAGLMLAPMAGQALADKSPMIEMFDGMERLQAAGKQLDAAMYAEFIATAYKKAEDLGARNRLVQAIGQHYEQTKATAGTILSDIASGKIDEIAAAAEQKIVSDGKAEAENFKQKQVMGKHTSHVLKGRGEATPAPAAQPDSTVLAAAGTPETKISKPMTVGTVTAAPSHAVGGAA